MFFKNHNNKKTKTHHTKNHGFFKALPSTWNCSLPGKCLWQRRLSNFYSHLLYVFVTPLGQSRRITCLKYLLMLQCYICYIRFIFFFCLSFCLTLIAEQLDTFSQHCCIPPGQPGCPLPFVTVKLRYQYSLHARHCF